MGAQKKKAKFVAKGLLSQKIKQRNAKKKFQAMKDKKRNRFERNSDAPSKKKPRNGEAEAGGNKKDEPDMLDEMDVDDFLNADFLDSDNEDEDADEEAAADDASDDEGESMAIASKAKAKSQQEKDDDDVDDGSSSEEEDESALDPRYMTGTPFGGDDDDDEAEAEEKEEDDEQEQEQEQEEQAAGRTVVTMAILQKAEKECFETKSVSGLRRLTKIFSDACRSSDAADSSKSNEITYDVQSSAVYNRLMVNVFRKTHETLTALVALESSSEEDGKFKVDDKKWKKNALVIRRFFSCACYLLEQTTGQDIQTFVLRELVHYIPFVVPCPKTSRRMLKALLKLWAKLLNANVCMLAFVRIRDMALAVPFPFLELCLKGIYVTYMRNTKFTNEVTLPHHILMGNCVVELFGLDLSSSYQHAFVYIRELAIAVRKTITSPGPDSFKAVLNWQFFNQLRVWTAVVCAYPAENQLRALVYPLSQLLLAVVRLSSTLRFAPLRFHCVKLLQQLALATNSFIPTSPALLEVLQLEPFRSSYKGSGGKKAAKGSNPTTEVDLELCVKLSKTALDAKRVHDQIIVRLFELLQRECDVYKFNVAFPELAVPLQLTLNKFMHACAVPKWKAQARGLSDSIKKRADWIRSKRSGLDVSPKDTAQLDDFLRAEREAAVKKIFEKDASDLQEKLDASAEASKEKEEKNGSEQNEDGKKKKNKKKNKKQRGKKGTPVDEETVAKVKKMSLKEFKKSVAEVDAADEVGDFNFSSDEE